MIYLGDITKIHGDQIEPVDCITFGSPCQGLSMAGKRLGFDDNRSVLFLDAARIIKEMRTATNGMYPTFAVWENVPGAFSSNGGEDFRAVLEELTRIAQPDVSIPRPSGRGGRWSKAGAIAGNGWSLAWRQLDAQYWGVPQRRKRIALVVDFAGGRAEEILFERESVPGHPDPCIPSWKSITRLAQNCTCGNDRMVGKRSFCISGNTVDRETNQNGTGVRENGSFTVNTVDRHAVAYSITQPVVFDARGNGDGKIAPTITGDHESRITDYTAVAVDLYNGAVTGDKTASITCRSIGSHSGPQVVEQKTFAEQSYSSFKMEETSGTIKGCGGGTGYSGECLIAEKNCLTPWDSQGRRVYDENGKFPSLQAREKAGGNQQTVLTEIAPMEKMIRWIVRRLTPTECERLQGYPDGWTDIGEWTDTKGKKHKAADSPRYKALGNSIALPQWFWIVQKMKRYLPAGATLGSLFDGIGGFPLVWETTYGTGTARWASEIEEFPIAVTKKHFPERNEHEN